MLFYILVSFSHETGLPEGLPRLKVLMFVSEENHHRTETAFTMAKSLLSSGHEVFIVLEGPSVRLAQREYKGKVPYEKTLSEIVRLGGRVYVCPYWGGKLGVKSLREGIEWANPQVIFPELADTRTKVMVW